MKKNCKKIAKKNAKKFNRKRKKSNQKRKKKIQNLDSKFRFKLQFQNLKKSILKNGF